MNADIERRTGSIWRRSLLALSVPAMLMTIAACSVLPGTEGSLTVSGSAGPAGVGTADPAITVPARHASPTGTTPGTTPAATTPATTTKGCPAGGAAIPPGARSATTADLDGDGRADRIWLADLDDARVLGVRTASGAVFSTTFSPGTPSPARAFGGRVIGGAIILLQAGGTTQSLYAVTGCTIVPTLNAENVRWSFNFDAESAQVRAGAGCIRTGPGRRLVGYHVEGDPAGSTFDVTRSTVDLSDGGRRATAGPAQTLGRSLPKDSPIVRTALTLSCDPYPGVSEPS